MNGGGSGLWLLVTHELRFKSNWRLKIQGTVTTPLVIPSLDANKELLAGSGRVSRHAKAAPIPEPAVQFQAELCLVSNIAQGMVG